MDAPVLDSWLQHLNNRMLKLLSDFILQKYNFRMSPFFKLKTIRLIIGTVTIYKSTVNIRTFL